VPNRVLDLMGDMTGGDGLRADARAVWPDLTRPDGCCRRHDAVATLPGRDAVSGLAEDSRLRLRLLMQS
jgi:hypothetical protein